MYYIFTDSIDQEDIDALDIKNIPYFSTSAIENIEHFKDKIRSNTSNDIILLGNIDSFFTYKQLLSDACWSIVSITPLEWGLCV